MAKQKDGRYRAKITVGRDADGNQIVKYVSGRTKKELEAAKAELKKQYVWLFRRHLKLMGFRAEPDYLK